MSTIGLYDMLSLHLIITLYRLIGLFSLQYIAVNLYLWEYYPKRRYGLMVPWSKCLYNSNYQYSQINDTVIYRTLAEKSRKDQYQFKNNVTSDFRMFFKIKLL